jgi:hypothetical protein
MIFRFFSRVPIKVHSNTCFLGHKEITNIIYYLFILLAGLGFYSIYIFLMRRLKNSRVK